MTARTLSRNWTAKIEHAIAGSPMRELTWSLAASAGLASVILGVGFVCGSRPCASAIACWGLVVAGILGTHMASRDVSWGWLLLVSLQPLWIAYAFATEQYGFAVGSVAYGAGQLNGFLRASRGD